MDVANIRVTRQSAGDPECMRLCMQRSARMTTIKREDENSNQGKRKKNPPTEIGARKLFLRSASVAQISSCIAAVGAFGDL